MTAKLVRVTMMVSAAAVLAATLVANAQSKDPFVGTWTLNVAKSKYSPGPVPKSITSTYEAAGKGYKVAVKNQTGTGTIEYRLHDQSRWSRVEADRKQSECGYVGGEADRRQHAGEREQEGRQGHHHPAERPLARWQDEDGDDNWHRCAGTESQQRCGVRETVGLLFCCRAGLQPCPNRSAELSVRSVRL